MTRPPCYIIAPYSAPTAAEIDANVARAEALGRLAALSGYAPIVVHSMIGGVFASGELDDDPEARARGIECDLALLRLVAKEPGGAAWVLLRDDGNASPGSADEIGVWHDARHDGLTEGTWAWWRQRMECVGA